MRVDPLPVPLSCSCLWCIFEKCRNRRCRIDGILRLLLLCAALADALDILFRVLPTGWDSVNTCEFREGGVEVGPIQSIRTLRFHHGEMTQQELADKVGVTRQTIVAIENAKYSPSLELAFRIAHVFGVPLEEVFSYDPD